MSLAYGLMEGFLDASRSVIIGLSKTLGIEEFHFREREVFFVVLPLVFGFLQPVRPFRNGLVSI